MTNLGQHLDEAEWAEMMKNPLLMKIFKNPDQGAATSVWAATAAELEGKGGKYLDDCQIMGPVPEGAGPYDNGTGIWAYDQVKEKKMWKTSLELVGLEDDL